MVVVRGEQHFSKLFKDWSCIAAPIRSPGGDIIGCLDISMHSEENPRYRAALVQLAAKYIEKIYAEKLAAEMLTEVVISPELLSRFDTLSRREKEVFRSIAEGKTICKIAKEIGIGIDTVKTYQKRLYKKLGARNKIDCLNKARELDQVIE
jgi:DNA-binding NarL/FixJ family response regulator